MRIWLVNPRTEGMISTELPGYVTKEVGCFPPLGLLYVAGYLRKHSSHEVELFDMPARDMPYSELSARIAQEKPDVVGITSTTHNLVEARRAAECVKSAAPQTTVCLGGPHVQAFPEQSLAIDAIDVAIRGEGEVTFFRYLQACETGASLSEVNGLVFREGDSVQVNPPAEPPDDLDALPFPARELIEPSDYRYVLGKESQFMTVLTTRGCPYKCIFCSTPHGKCRLRSPSSIVDEMLACMELGAEEIHLIDDTFNIQHDRVRAVSEEILQRGMKVRWSFRGRVDSVERDALQFARRAGCERIHFGIETGTAEGMALLRKQITPEQARRALQVAREAGIATAAYFLIGCPHEKTRQDVLETIAFARDVNPDYALFNVLAIYPHTELFDMAVERGLIDPAYWEEFVTNPTSDFRIKFWEEHFSGEELTTLLNTAYRRFYLRPSVVWRNLRQAGGLADIRRKAGAALSLLGGRK